MSRSLFVSQTRSDLQPLEVVMQCSHDPEHGGSPGSERLQPKNQLTLSQVTSPQLIADLHQQKRDAPQATRCQRALALELNWSALDCFSCDNSSFPRVHCGWHGLDCFFCLILLTLLPVMSVVLRTILVVLRTIVRILPALSPHGRICPIWMIAAGVIVIHSLDGLAPGARLKPSKA